MRRRGWTAALTAAAGAFVAGCGAATPAGEPESPRADTAPAPRAGELAALLASRPPPPPAPAPELVVDLVCTGYGPGLRGTGIDRELAGALAVPPPPPPVSAAPLPFAGAAPVPVLVVARGCPGAAAGPGPAPRG